ncbi:hypothetical protein CU664_08695 [Pseudomonas syringae pv. actinidifoliorum]|nr:hypothetical protein [Pseudomonas syringae pv. actinidifoliorum]NAT63362.1 hypothetical protein [Pseudomonas syringae pv. actinidifoliorum]
MQSSASASNVAEHFMPVRWHRRELRKGRFDDDLSTYAAYMAVEVTRIVRSLAQDIVVGWLGRNDLLGSGFMAPGTVLRSRLDRLVHTLTPRFMSERRQQESPMSSALDSHYRSPLSQRITGQC